jgi:ribulose-phosphate 3-epimerase
LVTKNDIFIEQGFFMTHRPVRVAASILSADFGFLAEEVQKITKAQADAIHIDIMDGHFVKNLTLGPKAVGAIRQNTSLFLDVHLMMYNPFDYIERFVEQGADGITFHVEATENVEEILDYIKKCNKKAGLAINPETPFSMIEPYVEQCDLVLLMTVNPGFGGQKFMPKVLEKIQKVKFLHEQIKKEKKGLSPLDIQVDGGIEPKTAKLCQESGANFLVSGHYLFEEAGLELGIQNLKNC